MLHSIGSLFLLTLLNLESRHTFSIFRTEMLPVSCDELLTSLEIFRCKISGISSGSEIVNSFIIVDHRKVGPVYQIEFTNRVASHDRMSKSTRFSSVDTYFQFSAEDFKIIDTQFSTYLKNVLSWFLKYLRITLLSE